MVALYPSPTLLFNANSIPSGLLVCSYVLGRDGNVAGGFSFSEWYNISGSLMALAVLLATTIIVYLSEMYFREALFLIGSLKLFLAGVYDHVSFSFARNLPISIARKLL